MYVDRMDLSTGLGGTRGVEDVAKELGSKRQGAGGFLGQSVLRSYAYPNKFTVLGRWETVEEAWAFGANDVLTPLITGMTGPATVDLTRFEGYDATIETGAIPAAVADASFEQFADWTLSSIARATDYQKSREELFALQQTHNPGFVAARLYRSVGIPTKFLMHTIFKSRAAAQAGGTTPELREFVASHPAPNYANVSPSIEAYAVVHRL
jgi:heme-degrading monooxygenase HmoA